MGDLAPVRQWVYQQLNSLLPSSSLEITSKFQGAEFTKWTGSTQKGLEAKWKEEQAIRDAGGFAGTTTTCNVFLGTLVNKIFDAGGMERKRFDSFDLQGTGGNAWHYYPNASQQPQAGDFFQIGKPGPDRAHAKKGGTFKHVGVILQIGGGVWTTIESGQGGPTLGYDKIKRKGPSAFPPSLFMGWINIEEYFDKWKAPGSKSSEAK